MRIPHGSSGEIAGSTTNQSLNGYELMYSTQMPSMTGMSGGPVLDRAGNLIGIHSRSETDQTQRVEAGVIIRTGMSQGVPISYFAKYLPAMPRPSRAIGSRSPYGPRESGPADANNIYSNTSVATASSTKRLSSIVSLSGSDLFGSQPLDEKRFAVLAQAVGRDRWKLLVLEQIKPRPTCWDERSDGLVNPSLNSFDFSGICSRYLDSNGYSLRTGGSDSSSFKLRVEKDGQRLILSGIDRSRGLRLVLARSNSLKRDRNAYVKLDLDPGWSLERRTYRGHSLFHLYFTHFDPLVQTLRVGS